MPSDSAFKDKHEMPALEHCTLMCLRLKYQILGLPLVIRFYTLILLYVKKKKRKQKKKGAVPTTI